MKMEHLKEITSKLPNLKDIYENGGVHSNGVSHGIKTLDGGPFREVVVHSEEGIAAARDTAPAGTTVVEHIHEDEEEYCIVFQGKIEIMVNGEILKAGAGEIIHIPKGSSHVCKIIEDAKMLVVTVPAAEGMKL